MTDSTDYRYLMDENTGTIYRGTLRRIGDDCGEGWRNYFDGDQMVAFCDGYARSGLYAVTENDDTTCAMAAYRESGKDEGALKKVAERITREWGHPTPADADFVRVGLDRGLDVFVLMWDATDEDTVRDYRDEIEAVWYGDVYRIEVEQYDPGMGMGGGDWSYADEVPEEWYGMRSGTDAVEREFPLSEFPAELLVEASE